ncbi:phosphotriesterase family protein [Microbacterium trichothecenolyticum]|uniref:Metal-dependent phosphotriesterase family hydrolase n=1 Tax=Microbacterium trichothecenolyticum TaxID=69370 RepID=A0ABU0TVK2_MICTR|nr:aryldialkylphosphatase [Microbacterium trichothecenolyticum]MDQ1123540.1 putative metal-dependent phosphotriesterase family hydrolase [Microbacterium trichothecenolyticum]
MTGFVRAVTGDVDPAHLGHVDYHEHLFQASPLLPGDDLDDEDLSREEAAQLAASGFDAMVDATPLGLGRRPAAIRRIAEATGLTVVLTTGLHRREHYADGHPLLALDVDELTDAFTSDLLRGAAEPGGERDASVRAGVLKAGLGYWRLDAVTGRAIEAIGRAHAATGAPVMVHLEHGTAAFEALDALAAEGVAADRVALAHIDRNPDPGLHAELAARGAFLGYDGPARAREHPDSVVLACLLQAAASGAASRILLGGDVARRTRYAAYGGIPGLRYLGDRFVPRLRREGGEDLAHAVLRRNPAAWLTWR